MAWDIWKMFQYTHITLMNAKTGAKNEKIISPLICGINLFKMKLSLYQRTSYPTVITEQWSCQLKNKYMQRIKWFRMIWCMWLLKKWTTVDAHSFRCYFDQSVVGEPGAVTRCGSGPFDSKSLAFYMPIGKIGLGYRLLCLLYLFTQYYGTKYQKESFFCWSPERRITYSWQYDLERVEHCKPLNIARALNYTASIELKVNTT
jgi:hypothetical protein